MCVVNSGTNGYGGLEESFVARKSFPLFHYQTLFLIHYPNDIEQAAFEVLTGDIPGLDSLWKEHLSILKKLAGFAKQNKIRMILVPIPPKEQFAMPETRQNYQEKLASFCAENGIGFLYPFEILERHTLKVI